MSSSSSSSLDASIREIDAKLKDIDRKIKDLKNEQAVLLAKKESLQDQALLEKSRKRSLQNWSGTNFSWSDNLYKKMKSVFKIDSLRPLQLEAINATMSNEDVILIMPTGGGKSLCYQLPAFLSNGLTLVISPLIALMEDQVHNLQKIGVNALLLSASSSKEDAKKASDALQTANSQVRLLYVTPERLAKSKRFMNQLQKCASMGRFARLAIDEVHCCSTWGHDFRPDYNYLGVLKDMFPKTPVLGLTATSSAKVTVDVQKMLNIEGALVLRAPFNRPNLHYSVLRKPDQLNACAELIAGWLKDKFRGQTGIIYTTTIKDCESLATELKTSGIKVGVYHAMLEGSSRSRVYERWTSGAIQVVVATIAFGLGIDKPDVRFVIHHALSKSMEMLYQESGRAGRDGKNAHCIVLYRLGDVSKLSTMVFTQRTGLENLYGIVKYCLEPKSCRRSIIADYFDEVWEQGQCKRMCDHCCIKPESKDLEISQHCRNLYRILEHAVNQDRQLTAIKLIDAWFQQGEGKLRLKDIKVPAISRDVAEAIIAYLLINSYLKEDFHYTAYSTISYLKRGPKSSLLDDKKHEIHVRIPKLSQDLYQFDVKSSDTSHNSEISSKKRKSSDVKKNGGLTKRDQVDVVDICSDDEVKLSAKKTKHDLFGSDDD